MRETLAEGLLVNDNMLNCRFKVKTKVRTMMENCIKMLRIFDKVVITIKAWEKKRKK